MIGETILARTSAQCKQAYNWRDNISLIIGLQSASWWSVNIYCANYWPRIGAPIIVPPILARLSAVLLNSANPTWDTALAPQKTFVQVLGVEMLLRLLIEEGHDTMNNHFLLEYWMSVICQTFEKIFKTKSPCTSYFFETMFST